MGASPVDLRICNNNRLAYGIVDNSVEIVDSAPTGVLAGVGAHVVPLGWSA